MSNNISQPIKKEENEMVHFDIFQKFPTRFWCSIWTVTLPMIPLHYIFNIFMRVRLYCMDFYDWIIVFILPCRLESHFVSMYTSKYFIHLQSVPFKADLPRPISGSRDFQVVVSA